MEDSGDESGDEWLDMAISNGCALTGKSVILLACEKNESNEESEEGLREECGQETEGVDEFDYGLWKPVPGFNNELYASSLGYIWQLNVKTARWMKPVKGTPKTGNGYVVIRHRGRGWRVHILVALAFLGPCPGESYTVDHIAKYDGDFIRERSDNRAVNLRWATTAEQLANRNNTHERRGRGVIVWKVGCSKSSAVRFDNLCAACRSYGLHPSGARNVATGKWVQTKGYHIEFNDQEPFRLFPDEEFRPVDGFLVSQYGRATDRKSGAYNFTPKIHNGQEYATVGSQHFTLKFHRLVAKAWPDIVGPCPGEGYTVDHINRDRSDNRASNLRWATYSEQIINQTKSKSGNPRLRLAVEAKPPDSDKWERYESMHDAVKQINSRYGTKLTQATFSMSLKINPRGRTLSNGVHSGWSIRAVLF